MYESILTVYDLYKYEQHVSFNRIAICP